MSLLLREFQVVLILIDCLQKKLNFVWHVCITPEYRICIDNGLLHWPHKSEGGALMCFPRYTVSLQMLTANITSIPIRAVCSLPFS